MKNLIIFIICIITISSCASTPKKDKSIKKSSPIESIRISKTDISEEYEVLGKIGFITLTSSQDSTNKQSNQAINLEAKIRQEAYDKYGDDADAVIEVQYSEVSLSGKQGTRVSGTVVQIIKKEK